jgi:hypothetical protein
MAEFVSRQVTTVRREFALRMPTNWAEVGKVCAALSQELKAAGLSPSDDRVTVEPRDEEIVFWYEKSREVSHG